MGIVFCKYQSSDLLKMFMKRLGTDREYIQKWKLFLRPMVFQNLAIDSVGTEQRLFGLLGILESVDCDSVHEGVGFDD